MALQTKYNRFRTNKRGAYTGGSQNFTPEQFGETAFQTNNRLFPEGLSDEQIDDVSGEYRGIDPKTGRPYALTDPQAEGFNNPLIGGEDAIALGLKSTIPIAELIGSRNRLRDLRKKLPTKFSRVDLSTPVVRDMTRPSFATPTRAPLGSSLAERTAGQKFGDAYQNAQEGNFEIQNEMQKRQQENQNVGILNQEEMINAQIANQEAQLNTNVNMLDYRHNIGRRDIALNALNYYLATDPNQLIQSKNMRQLGRWNWIVQNPKKASAKELAEAKAGLQNVTPTNTTAKQEAARTPNSERNGGKLKTKFSYGR